MGFPTKSNSHRFFLIPCIFAYFVTFAGGIHIFRIFSLSEAILLLDNPIEYHVLRLQIVSGKEVRLLLSKWSNLRFLRFPIDLGMDLSALSWRISSSRNSKYQIDSGSSVRLLYLRSRVCKYFN